MEQNTTHSMDLANSFGRGSAILCSVAAAYVGMLAVILRLGLNDTWISCALPIVGISWLILNGPVLFNERMAQDRPSLLWGTCFQTFFWLLGIIAFCRLGGVYAGAFCAIAGAICFGVNLSQFIHQDAKCARRTLFACGVLSGIACSGLSWGRGFLSPVFDEGLARGFAYKDTLFHMSISNMIRTHDTASTGLDGVLGISYHWGSHFAISALADGISATALQAYNLIFPVVFGPLFIHSLLLAGIACGGHRCRFSRDHLLGGLIALWALVMVAVVGFLPSPIGNEVGLRPSFMISESMATALIVLALGIGTIFPRLCRTAAFSLVPSANNTSKTWWAGLLFPLFAGALGV